VARIETGGAIRQVLQTKDAEGEVVAGMVKKLYGTNYSTVIERVEERIREINQSLPEGVRIVPYYQQKDIVEASVNTVLSALLQGIALVALVLLLFMGGLRPSLVVVLVIPFSLLFAFAAMRLFGISANLMSLGGLAIAIGMMVDGTIVMVDNVDRMLREAKANESRLHVVGRACREVARPILFAISIIIIVFLPLFSLSGVEGKTFRPLAFTVSAAMLGSLIFALLLAPFFSHLFMRRPKGTEAGRDAAAKEALLIRLIGGPYQKLIALFVRRRWAAVSLAITILAIGAAIFPLLGSEFTPRLREGNLLIRFTMAPSISLEEGKKNMALIEKRLLKIPEVAGAVTRLGRGEVGAHADPVNNAEMFVILKPRDQWRGSQSQEEIEAVIRRELGEIPGAQMNLSQPVEATVDELLEGVKAELAIKVFGNDLALLKQKADQIQGVIKEVPGAADVQVDQVTGTPQLLIRPSREAVARYGLNLADVQETIRTAVGGTTAGQVYDGVRRFDIYVRYQPQARQTQEAIEEILVQAPNGKTVPLTDLAEVKEVVGPRQITRENNQRFITIQCNVTGRDIGSFVTEAQEAIAARVKLPPGYFVTWGGMFRLQQEANKRLSVVVPVTLLLICLLLFSSFGSIKNSILILLNIPLALVGGVVALWLSGQNMSVPATVGFIALFGIALENGMVLVTYINQLVRDGVPMDEAAERAARLRLRSVLMTAVTTSLGLIPLLLASGTGSEVQRPLATVVVGGLVTSTILTLLVLPAMYQWFAIKIARKEDFRGNQPQGGTV
jgi:cobalt-zinc-cadmium resistance protein CzcA